MYYKNKRVITSLLLSLLSLNVYAENNKGGIADAEGAYGVLMPMSAALPNPTLTPGAINPDVTPENIQETICARGYSKTIRPAPSYTNQLKREGVIKYQYTNRRLRDYEEDHLIPLAVGGAPFDEKNLWPQPHHILGNWNSKTKDRLETKLHKLVCSGKVGLREAQNEIATNWIEAYKKYVGPYPLTPKEDKLN